MDAREFKQRYLSYHKTLYRVAYRLTGNAQDAEDLLQDQYLKMWQKRDELQGRDVTEAYLVTMMRHLYLDRLKLKRLDMRESVDEQPEPPDESSLTSELESRDEMDQMQTLIDALPERDGKVLKMHLVEERTYEEIERDTGLTQGHIRIIMMRTRSKLKEQYQKLTKTWTN